MKNYTDSLQIDVQRICALVYTTFCLLCLVPVYGQNEENIWVFGQGAGLDFNNNNPIPIQSAITGFGETATSVCDASGQLLFYTEGSYVWDRNHNLMPTGDDLTGWVTLDPNLGSATASTSQGAVIVPMPGSTHQYYIFSLTAQELQQNAGRLYYSVVDMNLNGGLGDIAPGQKGIFIDSMFTEQMAVVRGDNCNIWLVVFGRVYTQQFFDYVYHYKSFEITSAGVNIVPVISNTTLLPGATVEQVGSLNFSNDRTKIITTNDPGLKLYNFDLATGQLAPSLDFNSNGNNAGYYDACFSPDDSKLYITGASIITDISQFDLSLTTAADIVNSKTFITNASFTRLKRRYGKLYYIADESSVILGSINMPNLQGIACQPDNNAIQLLPGTTVHGGLPASVPLLDINTTQNTDSLTAPCFVQELTLSPLSVGLDYEWNDGATNSTHAVDTPGIYWVKYYTNACSLHVDTFVVRFTSAFPVPQLQVHPACKNENNGQAIILPEPGDTTTYTFTWKQGSQMIRGPLFSNQGDTIPEVTSGNYSLEIRAANGCDTILTFFIPKEEYSVSFTGDTLICLGTIISFQNTSGMGFQEYTWDFGDSIFSTLENPEHIYNQAGRYRVQLLGKGTVCTDTASYTITVDAPLNNLSFTKNKSEICMGENIGLRPFTDETATSLQWNFGDGNGNIVTANEDIQHAYDKAGNMVIQLTANFRACPPIDISDSIRVYPLPNVYLGPDSSICLDGNPIYLKNLREPPDVPYRYLWNTKDTTEVLPIVHPGHYSLSLSAGPIGCTTTESIEVTKDCYLDIPNAFTPNGDNYNDYFFPRQFLSKSITYFRMTLFNRWGQVIFETTNPNGRGWDGRLNNQEQPMGVYIYLVEVTFDNNRSERYQGNVTLLR